MLAALTALGVAAGPPVAPFRVGQIIIIGNEGTPQSLILGNLPLYPGMVLGEDDLTEAHRCLSRLRWLGIHAHATVPDDPFNPDSPFKPIHIDVRETWLARHIVGPAVQRAERVEQLVTELIVAGLRSRSGRVLRGPSAE